jgi:uncharacterized membrane protein YfcA
MPGFESFSLTSLIAIGVAVTLAGFIQGAIGFGFPFIATPVVAMVSDMRIAIITVLLPTLLTTIATLFSTGPLGATLARFWPMPIYAFLGALAGTSVFVAAPGFPFQLVLGVIILVYLNLDRITRGDWPAIRAHERAFAPVAGIAGGLFEGTANVAAPPLIIYYLALGLTPVMLVQALQICFVIGKTTQFAVLTVRGGVTWTQWAVTLPLAVTSIAGVVAGTRVRSRIDAIAFRRWVKRALLVIALVLITQYAYLRWLV